MPGRRVFTPDEVLTAANVNDYLMDQTAPRFASPAARDAQWPAAPNGAACVTVDTSPAVTWQRIGGAWVGFLPSKVTVVQTGFGGTFSTTQVQLGSLSIPSAAYDRKALIVAEAHESTPGPTTQWQCNVKVNGGDVMIGKGYFGMTFSLGARLVTLAAATAYTVTVHGQVTWGSGSANVPADANFNNLTAVIFN